MSGARWTPPSPRPRSGPRPRPRSAAPAACAPPTSWNSACPRCWAKSCARRASRCPNAIAEVREAVDFLRYYGAEVAPRFRQRQPSPARPGRLHQPLELPARDLHRAGGGGAGGGQPGARQARRGNAAHRRPCGGDPARSRRARRRRPIAARRGRGGRGARRRAAHGGRPLHRLDRRRPPDPAPARPAASVSTAGPFR